MTGNALRQCRLFFPALLALVWGSPALGAEHSPQLQLRLRVADLQDGENSGRATSALVRWQLASRWNRHWSTLLEVDHVTTGWQNDHSDGVRFNGKPLIPDTPGTELNQLALRYRVRPAEFSLGRQRIEWDDQRFVGSNRFWQQDQTFDAAHLDYRLWMSSRLEYAYINRSHRIYNDGRDRYTNYGPPAYSYADHHRQHSHLARLEVNEWDYAQLVVYGLSIDNRDFTPASSHTLGVRYELRYRVQPIRYRLLLESAAQENRSLDERAQPHYYLVELGLGYRDFQWVARHEVLGSDQNTAFVTPLGSSYLFQGFAGAFTVTPDTGLEDTSVRINWRHSPWELSLRYHTFQAPQGGPAQQGGDLGRELDLELQYKPASDHTISLRWGDFRADSRTEGPLDRRRLYADYRYRF